MIPQSLPAPDGSRTLMMAMALIPQKAAEGYLWPIIKTQAALLQLGGSSSSTLQGKRTLAFPSQMSPVIQNDWDQLRRLSFLSPFYVSPAS